MHPPAMLKKVVEPGSGSLYMIRSVSDEEIQEANERFKRLGSIFKIERLRGQAA